MPGGCEVKPTKLGYIAISRGIFEHPLFRSRKAFSRLEAWEWLINAASWKPAGNRNKFGVVHTERGEFAITRRELACEWNWSKSRVDRFLSRLQAESMIRVGNAKNGPKNGPETAPIIGYPRTMINICNSDKFQLTPKMRWGQKAGQKAGQNHPELPLESTTSPNEPTKQSDHKNQESAEKGLRHRPKHLQQTADGKWIWCQYGMAEYGQYAADYFEVRGESITVRIYEGGAGNWFFKAGARLWPRLARRKRA